MSGRERECTLSVDFEGRETFSRHTASLRVSGRCTVYRDTIERPVASRFVESKIALLAPVLLVATHGLAYPRQTFRHLVDMPIVENEDDIAVLLYGSEFHEGMIISSGVETDGDYLVLCSSMKKRRRSRTRLGLNIRLTASE